MVEKRVQAVVSGKVVGVGFRYFAAHAAHRLGLRGAVRNLPTGDVEAIAEGGEGALSDFLAELQTGPSSASVNEVRTAWAEPTGEFQNFSVVG